MQQSNRILGKPINEVALTFPARRKKLATADPKRFLCLTVFVTYVSWSNGGLSAWQRHGTDPINLQRKLL